MKLSERLRDAGFDCFLDRSEFASGDDWKAEAQIALRTTKRLVVIATRDAIANSDPVRHELEVFTGRNDRVIPIVFDQRFSDEERETYPTLAYLPKDCLEINESRDRLEQGPSDPTLEQLVNSYKVLRRRTVRTAVFASAFAIVFLAAVVAFGLWGVAEVARDQARAALVDSQRELARNLLDRGAAAIDEEDSAGLFFLLRAFQTSERLNLSGGHGLSRDESMSHSALQLMAGGGLGIGYGLYHENELARPEFSSDGSVIRVLTVNYDGEPASVRFWEANTGRPLGSLPVSDEFFEVSTSRNWTAAVLWSGFRFQHLDVLSGRGRSVESDLSERWDVYVPQAVSLDGGLFATVSGPREDDPDGGRSIELWDVDTGQLRHALPTDLEAIEDFALSEDGGLLFVESRSGLAWLDTSTGRRLDTQPIEGLRADDARILPDGTRLAFADESGTTSLWRTRPAEEIASHETSSGQRPAPEFSPDGSVLVARRGSEFQLFDAVTGAVVGFGRHAETIVSAEFSPDGRWLATVGKSRNSERIRADRVSVFKVWDTRTASLVGECEVTLAESEPPSEPSARFSPGGDLLLIRQASELQVFDWRTGFRQSGPWRTRSTDSTFGPDGRVVLALDRSDRLVRVRRFEIPSSPDLRQESRLENAVLSSRGRRLAAVVDQKTVRLWSADSGQPLARELRHPTWVESLGFFLDSRWLFTLDSDGDVRIWNAEEGDLQEHFQSEEDGDLLASTDGSLVFVGGEGGWIWDPEASARRIEIPRFDDWSVVAVTTDLSRLAVSGFAERVEIWDIPSRRLVQSIDAMSGAIQNIHEPESVEVLSFSPAGELLLTASNYGVVRLWRVETGELIHELQNQGGMTSSAAFAPDGRLVATGHEAAARLWDVGSGHLIREMRGHGRFRKSGPSRSPPTDGT